MYSKRKRCRDANSSFMYIEMKNRKLLRNAASRNDCERLTKLLNSGVNPNAADENGRTALHLASANGYSDVVKILLSYKADCNVLDKSGNTPLHLAVCTASTPTINLLLNAGCSPFQKGHNGCTPLQLAQTKLWLLQKYSGPDYTELKSKISDIIETMKLLLNDEVQEKKLADLFSSGLSLNENSDLSIDLNVVVKTLNTLKLEHEKS